MTKPKARLKNLYIKEIAGVYRGAQGKQPAVIMKRADPTTTTMLVSRVVKIAVLTDEVDGHTHTIDLDDPSDNWCDRYSTSYQTATGADSGHMHAWTYDPATGAVTVAADSGHSHVVTAVVPADVRAAAAVAEAAERQRRAAQTAETALAGVASGTMTVAVTVDPVAMRAADHGNSPRSGVPPTVESITQENQPMDPKIAKMIAVALLLPEAQRAHVAKLATDDLPSLQAFMSLDAAGREAATTAALAADPVMYTTRAGGQIRKSHGELAKQQAQQLDEQAAQIATQNEALTISKAAAELADLEKRAAEIIPLIGKSAAVRVALLRGANTITDGALRSDYLEALKGANHACQMLTKSTGISDGGAPPDDSPQAAFNAARVEFAKAKLNVTAPSESQIRAVTSEFLKTAKGSELYGDLNKRTQAQA